MGFKNSGIQEVGEEGASVFFDPMLQISELQ
jgi:hypothetical protein